MTPAFSVIGGTLYGNRGAEMMLSVVVGCVRQRFPTARIHVFSYLARDDRRECTDRDLTIYSASPAALVALLFPGALLFAALMKLFGRRTLRFAPAPLRALGESSCLLDIAGVSFIDGREKFLPFNVLMIWPAMLLGVPVVKLSQAMGPISTPLNRLAARMTLPHCERVWARGDVTFGNLRHTGLPGLCLDRADDLAFLYQERFCISRRAPAAVASVRKWAEIVRHDYGVKGVIGICPSSVLGGRKRRGGKDYQGRLVTLVNELTAGGFGVFLFPNATRVRAGHREHNNDLPLLRRISDEIISSANGSGKFHCVDSDVNGSDISDIVAVADLVVVSRFHAMIAALVQQRALMVLGWSHKYAEVMDRFGLVELVPDFEQLNGAQLHRKVIDAWDQREQIESRIKMQLADVKSSSARQFQLLPVREGSKV